MATPILKILTAASIGITAAYTFKRLAFPSPKNKYFPENAQSKFRRKNDFADVIVELEEKTGTNIQRTAKKTSEYAIWSDNSSKVERGVFSGTKNDFYAYVQKNIVFVRIYNSKVAPSNNCNKQYGFGICGSIMAFNLHAIDMKEVNTLVIWRNYLLVGEDDVHFTVKISPSDIYSLGNDLCFIDIGSQFTFRDMSKIIPTGIIEEASGYICTSDIHAKYGKNMPVSDAHGDFVMEHFYMYEYEHSRGHCGLPLMLELTSNKWVVAGIHMGGSEATETALSTPITRSMCLDIHKKFALMIPHSSPHTDLQLSVEPHKHSSMLRLPPGTNINYVGTLPGNVLMNQKSKLTRSCLKIKDLDLLFATLGHTNSSDFVRPYMSPAKVKGIWLNPYDVTLKKMDTCEVPIDRDTMRLVVGIYADRICTMLKDRGIHSLSPLPMEDALNGFHDNDFMRRMNFSTSPGFGYEESRKCDLVYIDDEDHFVEANELLTEKVSVLINVYLDGNKSDTIINCCCKDEARLSSKVLKGATRLFYCSPIEAIVVARMYLMPFYSLMCEFNDIFCCAIGLNTHMAMDEFYTDLTEFSTLIFEGDYSGYDTSMPAEISRGAASVVIDVCERMGYNEEALTVVRGLLSDGLTPILNMNKDIFVKPGVQPSGKYATAEDNCIKNMIIILYVFYSMPECQDMDFFEFVFMRTYGDDVIGSVKKEIIKLFNIMTFSKGCEDYLNIKFTSSDKGDTKDLFLSPEECSFLKRMFKYHSALERYVGILDLDSCYKTLQWFIPSKSVTTAIQRRDTYNSVLREVYFHCDSSDVYDDFRNTLISLVVKRRADISEYSLEMDLVTYEGLTTAYTDGELLEVKEDEPFAYIGPIVTESSSEDDLRGLLPVNRKISTHSIHTDGVVSMDHKRHALFTNKNTLENAREEFLDERKTLAYDLEESSKHIGFFGTTAEFRQSYSFKDRHLLPKEREWLSMSQRLDDIDDTIALIDRKIRKRTARIRTESGTVVNEQEQGGDVFDTKENFSDMAGADTDYEVIGYSVYPNVGQDAVLGVEDFISRPVEITSGTISVGSHLNLVLKIWALFFSNPAVRAKLRQFAYIRCDLCVKIIFSASPFHYQEIIVSYQPHAGRNENLIQHESVILAYGVRALKLNYLSQAKGSRRISVSNNRPLVMNCAYINHKPAMRLYNTSAAALGSATDFADIEDMGSLYINSVNVLRSASSVSTDISYNVYAWAENVEMGPPTSSILTIVTESGDERETGPVERFFSGASNIANMAVMIPPLAPFALASSLFFKGLSLGSAIFGWARPILVTNPIFTKNRPFANGCQAIGAETGKRLTLDPKQELTIDPRIAGVDVDELIIGDMAKIPTYLTSFTWDESDVAMVDVLWSCGVTPQLASFATDFAGKFVFQPTASCFAVQPFAWWNGDVVIDLKIVCSSYHRGKLLIRWEPNVNQIVLSEADIDLNKNFIKVIDIQETQDISFCIEWGQVVPWLQVLPPTTLNSIYGGSINIATLENFLNGYITITPFTELTSPDMDGVSVNVYVSCDNLRVNFHSGANMPTSRILTESAGESSCEVMCEPLNPSTASTDNISLHYFGEEPFSFRSLLKRYVTMETVITVAPAVTTHTLSRTDNNMPNIYPAFGSSTFSPTLYGYLRYAFMGIRGSIRNRRSLREYDTGVNYGEMNRVVVKLAGSTNVFLGNTVWTSSQPTMTPNGSVVFVPHTNGGVEYDTPFYSNNLYCYSFADNLVGASPVGSFNEFWVRQHTIEFELDTINPGETVICSRDVATGEDFSFFRFNGGVLYSN
jgi:hypothetical protein